MSVDHLWTTFPREDSRNNASGFDAGADLGGRRVLLGPGISGPVSNGEGGIRTHGGFHLAGFQDRLFMPEKYWYH